MQASPNEDAPRPVVEAWELELIRKVAAAFRTADREDLEADLGARLIALKASGLRGIRNWKAYLAKFLYNKSANWVRDARKRDRRRLSIEDVAGRDAEIASSEVSHSFGDQQDLLIALKDLQTNMKPELVRFWEYLLQENGNQMRVARRLGIHRNTARRWLREIRQILERHGFQHKN